MARSKNLSVEDRITRNKKIGLIIKLIILFLLLVIIFLFWFKKNVVPTDFRLKGKENVEVHYGDTYKDEGYIAALFGRDLSSKVTVKDNIDYKKIGKYKIDYTLEVKPLNIYKVITRNVAVIDVIPPELKVEMDDEVVWDMDEEFVVPKYTATDNIDGDITNKVVVDNKVNVSVEGDYTVTFTVSDSSNNKVEKKIKVTVEDRWKNTYIIVTKSRQTLEYYEKGVLVFTSPVVTGNDYDTPLGNWRVNNKLPTARLVGPNREWDVYVNWWIAFIGSSHGFHDSSWRTEFGGNVWTYNPTHGCINLPKDKAYELYQWVEVGTPVYIVS